MICNLFVIEGRHACAMYTFPPNEALFHVCSDVTTPMYLNPEQKFGAMVGAVNTVTTVNIILY